MIMDAAVDIILRDERIKIAQLFSKLVIVPAAFALIIGFGLCATVSPARATPGGMTAAGQQHLAVSRQVALGTIISVQDDQGDDSSNSGVSGDTTNDTNSNNGSDTDNSLSTGNNGDPDMAGGQPGNSYGPYPPGKPRCVGPSCKTAALGNRD
jgi:hypothetical protein